MIFPERYPRAIWRPVSYASEAKAIKESKGWVLHVVCGNGSPWRIFQNAKSPNRRFSHLWFSRTGTVEQYGALTRQSWAQGDGNSLYISCETEGFPEDPLTSQQLHALALWHAWSQTVDLSIDRPGLCGVGTHEMGGVAWGNHACPGMARANQRLEIIRRAREYVTTGGKS